MQVCFFIKNDQKRAQIGSSFSSNCFYYYYNYYYLKLEAGLLFCNLTYYFIYYFLVPKSSSYSSRQGLILVSHWEISVTLSSSYHAWSPRCYCKFSSASLTFTVRPLSLFWIGSKTNQKCHFFKILLKYFEIFLEPL